MTYRKRASYREGVEWIALNDNGGNGDGWEEVRGYVTTCLLADLFGKDQDKVARDICIFRRKHGLYVKPATVKV